MSKKLLDLDDELLAQAVEIADEHTQVGAVRQALEEFVRRHAAADFLKLMQGGMLADLSKPGILAEARR
ncbi:MAG: type II toxin-antitoxin system VapB family antitoxin [Propionibacteriaceae bacterium]|jgi:Arc/MetJ family transcription regulator|nr:type II toxin-antitoxin system VapB family antitoxin [Propionibacteriaceae bacterium]